jgi:hypothetical protein
MIGSAPITWAAFEYLLLASNVFYH